MKKKLTGLKSKKGLAMMEMLFAMILIFVFGFISIIIFQTYKEISPDLRATFVEEQSNSSVKIIDDISTRYPNTFDYVILLMFILLWAVVIVASFMIDSHPIFFVASLFIFVFILIAMGILGQFYDELILDSSLAGLSTDFPITNWLISHIFFITIILGFTVLLVLYGRGKFS